MAYILEFLDLIDTPSTFSSQAGKIAVVNSGENALEFVSGVNANKLDGVILAAAAPVAGDVLVYDGTVDNQWEAVTPPWLRLDGGTMTGFITLHANPTNNMHAVTKQYVDLNFSPAGHNHDGDYIQEISGTPVAGNLIEISDYDTVLDSGISSAAVEDALAVFPLVGWPTGATADFIADTDIGFDEGTRTFTLTVNEDVSYWVKGREYTLDSGDDPSIQIPDTEGEYFIYLKTDGTLGYTTTWSSDVILESNAYLVDVYWDADNNKYLFMLDERHMFMPPSVHVYIHRRFSAYIESGFALGDISVDESGDLDAHATMSVASGVLVDEDRDHSFAGAASPAKIPVFYLSGSTPVLRRFTATNAPVVKGTDRAYYNQFSGGSWGLAEVGQGDFCYYWIVATNDPEQPVVAVMGQTDYATKLSAHQGALSEVSSIILLLPFEEISFIGGVLYQTSTAYDNTWASRIVSTEEGDDYFDLRQSQLGSGSAPSSHAALADRGLADQHPDSAISLSGTHAALLVSATSVADAMTKLDDIDDADIPLSGAMVDEYTGCLAAATTIKDAMDALDNLDDSEISLTHTFTGWLLGISGGVDDALAALDDLSGGVYMTNNASIFGRESGSPYGWFSQIKVNSSDEVEVGNDTLPLRLKGDGILGIDDVDIGVTGGYSGLLSGDDTLDEALDTIDAISTEFPTRQQVMNGSKSSVSDNTVTTIATFTMPTGPSSLAVALTFVGTSNSTVNACKVIIQGWLMAVRNSSDTVTAEWVETFNDNKTSGISVTFGTCEVTAVVSSADVLMKIQLDTNLDQTWTVKWTALMSDDVTVTAA